MTEDSTNGDRTVKYNPRTGIYATSYGNDTNPPSVAIIEAFAEITDNDVTELDSLHEVTELDVEALDELFKPTVAGAPRGDGRVEFTYIDFQVSVFSFGRIEIEPTGEDSA